VLVELLVEVLVGVLVEDEVCVAVEVEVPVGVLVDVAVEVPLGVEVTVAVAVLVAGSDVAVTVGVGHGRLKTRRVPGTNPFDPPLHRKVMYMLPVSFCTPMVALLAGVAIFPPIMSNCCANEFSYNRTSKLMSPFPE
jgi:hypothetical protein